MKSGGIILTVLIALVAGFAGAGLATRTIETPHSETAYERVMRTGTIRCAYMLWAPFMERDPNTGAFSGMNYDMMNATAESLGLKVDWNVEIAAGTQVESLRSNKADAICAGEGPIMTSAARYLAYTDGLAYFPFFAYVRADDTRFTGDNARIDANDVTIAAVDGDVSGELARLAFPNARTHPQPQFAEPTQMMMDVAAGKADVMFSDELFIAEYMKNNPGKLRKVSDRPVTVIPNTFSTLRSDEALANMLTQGMRNIDDRGQKDAILAKYGIGSTIRLYPLQKPYVRP